MPEAEITSFSALKDEQVIERIIAGEKSMYELIMRRYNRCLFRIGLSILKNDADVEDAMQETYIKAYQHLGDFERRSSFGTWLTRIMINECLQKQKRQNKFETVDGSMLLNVEFHRLKNIEINSNRTPEQNLLNRELKNVLERAILTLPENYTQVYVMREVERMNVKETSECLQISEENVKVRLNRAKTLLKEKITEVFNETEIFSFHLIRCNRIVENVMKRI